MLVSNPHRPGDIMFWSSRRNRLFAIDVTGGGRRHLKKKVKRSKDLIQYYNGSSRYQDLTIVGVLYTNSPVFGKFQTRGSGSHCCEWAQSSKPPRRTCLGAMALNRDSRTRAKKMFRSKSLILIYARSSFSTCKGNYKTGHIVNLLFVSQFQISTSIPIPS